MTETLRSVQLLGLPVAVHRRAVQHDDTLRRELALVRAGQEAEAGARLAALSQELQGRFQSFTTEQSAQLQAAGDDATIDLTFQLPVEAADGAERLGALLDEVDELCRSGELVTLVTPPEAVAYRRWFLGEFVRQLRDGEAPRPWSAQDAPAVPDDVVAHASPVGDTLGPPLFVDGDLDLFGAPTLRAAIAERLEAGATSIVVDLSSCSFIDSVGLSLLLTTRERCRAAGGGLSVIGAGDNALRLFETVGVRELLVRQ
jgi:anti-anti-sigma factor